MATNPLTHEKIDAEPRPPQYDGPIWAPYRSMYGDDNRFEAQALHVAKIATMLIKQERKTSTRDRVNIWILNQPVSRQSGSKPEIQFAFTAALLAANGAL